MGSAFLDRIRKVPNSKFESDSSKKINCFIDGYVFVNSERFSFSGNFDYFKLFVLSIF